MIEIFSVFGPIIFLFITGLVVGGKKFLKNFFE